MLVPCQLWCKLFNLLNKYFIKINKKSFQKLFSSALYKNRAIKLHAGEKWS